MTFNDDFAPASSHVRGDNLEKWINPRTRWMVYGDHLYKNLTDALLRAQELGALPFPFPMPFAVSPLKAGYTRYQALMFIQSAVDVIETLDEQSEDWLCLAVYLHCAQAALVDEQGSPAAFVADATLRIGAILRELELVRVNRADAQRGRKVKRGAGDGGNVRSRNAARSTDARLAEMRRLLEKNPSVSRAASITAQKGLGTAQSNRQLWYKHRKKV